MLWTHNLNDLSYTKSFGTTGKQAIIMGSGTTADQAYGFASSINKSITLGAYGSVGVAGGFAMGGGHGPFGPTHGLAVDNILQYTIVTADGTIRNVNSAQDPDLFWALRGGGGAVWGVVTQVVYQVYPSTPFVAVVYNLTVNPLLSQAEKLQAIADFTFQQATYEVGWRKQGWSGYTFMSTAFILFSHFRPTADYAAAVADFAGFQRYIDSTLVSGTLILTLSMKTQFPNFESCRELIFRVGEGQTPIAYDQRLAGRLIPVAQYGTVAGRQTLSQAIAAAYGEANGNTGVPAGDVQYRAGESIQLYTTGPRPAQFGGPSGNDTGVNPAWRDSIWEVLLFVNWVEGMSPAGRTAVADKTHAAMDHVRQFGTGCYYSEADVLEQDWQTAFFGANYPRLVNIKKRYDPNNTFIVYKGIGYEGQEGQDAFRCYTQA